MADYIKRQSLKFGSALISSAAVRVPIHAHVPHTAMSLPGALNKVEHTVTDASIGAAGNTRVQIRIAGAAWLGQAFLRVSLADPGGADTFHNYVGFNVIRSMRVLCGSEVLAEHGNYRAALKAWLRYLPRAQAEAIMFAMGGTANLGSAKTVCIPLITPWGITDGHADQAQTFVPLSDIRSNISFEITFNNSASTNLATAYAPAEAIASCSIVYYEASFIDGSTVEAGAHVPHLYRDFQSFDQVVTGGAVTAQANDLSSVVGNCESLHVFSTTAATFFGANCGDFATSNLFIARCLIDGREYFRTGTAAAEGQEEAALEAAVFGYGRAVDAATGSDRVPVLPLAIYPRSTGFTGGLPTQELKNLQLLVTSTTAGAYEICSVGTAELVHEGGKLVRRRM